MKKDRLCRDSYDEKNQEIAPVMIPSDDLDRVMMIQIQWWWSRSSEDPDPVMIPHDDLDPMMMTSDDPDRVMMSHDDPDSKIDDDLKTQKTWDADDEMIQFMQRRRPVLKIVSKEYLLS